MSGTDPADVELEELEVPDDALVGRYQGTSSLESSKMLSPEF